MKEFTKFTACLFLVLGFLSSDAEAQSPTGDRTWPLWTRPGQGSAVKYGAQTCTNGGAEFLTVSNAYRTSVIIMNTHATEKATICPKGVPDADGGACSESNGLVLPAGAAVTLDRSVLAAPSGFLCFGNNTTIRYWAEQ